MKHGDGDCATVLARHTVVDSFEIEFGIGTEPARRVGWVPFLRHLGAEAGDHLRPCDLLADIADHQQAGDA